MNNEPKSAQVCLNEAGKVWDKYTITLSKT